MHHLLICHQKHTYFESVTTRSWWAPLFPTFWLFYKAKTMAVVLRIIKRGTFLFSVSAAIINHLPQHHTFDNNFPCVVN